MRIVHYRLLLMACCVTNPDLHNHAHGSQVLIAGELQETSKKLIARIVSEQDAIADSEGKDDDK